MNITIKELKKIGFKSFIASNNVLYYYKITTPEYNVSYLLLWYIPKIRTFEIQGVRIYGLKTIKDVKTFIKYFSEGKK